MAFFWRKSSEEKSARKGDKSAILKLIESGKRALAIEILENFKEDPELRPILFRLYMEEGKYYFANQLIEYYDHNLATSKEKAVIYEHVGELEKAAKEYAKLSDWQSLVKACNLMLALERSQEALEYLQRASKLVPPAKAEEFSQIEYQINKRLGLVKEESLIEKLKKSLKKTRESVELAFLLRTRNIDEELFEELEEKLIHMDVGAKQSIEIVEELRKTALKRGISTSEDLVRTLGEILEYRLSKCYSALKEPADNQKVYLFLGVNGSGKTTTIGKLAYKFKSEGKRVLLCAADTFRSAAVEQLQIWAERSGAEIISKPEGTDPASVVFEAMQLLKDFDAILIDTAGRLHTKEPLIRELRKLRSVIQRFNQEEPAEVLLVLDATLGQNSFSQAKVFKQALDNISGAVLTKLDGSAKGGCIFGICSELSLPVKLIGVGEGIEDLYAFEPSAFVSGLIGR